MKLRSPRPPSGQDLSPSLLSAGLGAMKIATWEAHGSHGNLTARLGTQTGGPREFRHCAGRRVAWNRLIFPLDRPLVTSWLGKLGQGSNRAEPLEYRLKLKSGQVAWIRHWAKPANPPTSRARRVKTPTAFVGLVQLIDSEKHFETESLRALEAERETLGQELHDHTCQILVGLSCLTQAFSRSPSHSSTTGLKSLLDDLNQQLAEAVNHVRTRAHALVPAPAISRGFYPALRALAAQSELLHRVTIHLRLPRKPPRYPPLHVVHLHAIAGEAVRNAVTHGRATVVWITLRCRGKSHVFEVSDNGRGFASAPATRGIGLHLMRHRAAIIGAAMTIDHRQPTGTCVRLNYSMA